MTWPMFARCCVILPAIVFATELTMAQGMRADARTIEEIVAEYHRPFTGPEEFAKLELWMEKQPAKLAIFGTIKVLEDPYFQEYRFLAYRMLCHHGAAKYVEGRVQLLNGLRGSSVSDTQRMCYEALDPATRQAELEKELSIIANATSPDELKSVLRRLGGWGDYARPAFEPAVRVFQNEVHDLQVRWAAAYAIVRIGGGQYPIVFEQMNHTDHVGIKVVIWTLGKYFGESDSKRKRPLTQEELVYRRKARELALRTLRSPDKENARHAVEGLAGMFFGDEMLIGNDADGYQIHPDYLAALEYWAQHAPEEYARDGAKEELAKLDGEKAVTRTLQQFRRVGWLPEPAGVAEKKRP